MLFMILNTTFCVAFAAFAFVNLNDKDGWLWVSIYMIASAFCGLAVFEKYYPIAYLVVIIFYAIPFLFITGNIKDWLLKNGWPKSLLSPEYWSLQLSIHKHLS